MSEEKEPPKKKQKQSSLQKYFTKINSNDDVPIPIAPAPVPQSKNIPNINIKLKCRVTFVGLVTTLVDMAQSIRTKNEHEQRKAQKLNFFRLRIQGAGTSSNRKNNALVQ